MTAGFKSALALLGLSGPAGAAGGLLAPLPFMGAFAAPAGVTAGYRGLAAFWAGGAGAVPGGPAAAAGNFVGKLVNLGRLMNR